MPKFDSLADAKRIVLTAWESFRDRGSVASSIGTDEVIITWRFRSGTMDTGTAETWEFTGDQEALTDWWKAFGANYSVLPAQWKGPDKGYQINLIYTASGETWFNFHLTVPKPATAH